LLSAQTDLYPGITQAIRFNVRKLFGYLSQFAKTSIWVYKYWSKTEGSNFSQLSPFDASTGERNEEDVGVSIVIGPSGRAL
jgi:hypothetical protein